MVCFLLCARRCVALASRKAGSSVIVCTDGLANVGIGNLDAAANSDAERESVAWYGTVGEAARAAGVTVSVISLRGDECRLEHLGRVAEATGAYTVVFGVLQFIFAFLFTPCLLRCVSGGTIDRVDPLNLGSQFSNILANAVVATHVKAKMLVGRALRFRKGVDDEASAGVNAPPAPEQVCVRLVRAC